jgi:hypothetical protein
MKEEKVTKIRRIEDFISYLNSRSSVLSKGDKLGELVKCKTSKSILPPKTPIRPDISGLLAGFQRLWSDMSGSQARHVRPLSLIRLSSRVLEAFPRSPDMSDLTQFLSG